MKAEEERGCIHERAEAGLAGAEGELGSGGR